MEIRQFGNTGSTWSKTKRGFGRRNYNTVKQFLQRWQIRGQPWFENHLQLLSISSLAKRRLKSNTKKLVDIFEAYQDIFTKCGKFRIIQEVESNDQMKKEIHYLPHHAVFKTSSSTTRIRRAFDASAKNSDGNSLIDCLQKRPNF